MNKDVEQHLQELIEFYSKTDMDDITYLKKLFVRNLKDVQRRYVKYDKPRKEILAKAINQLNIEIEIIKKQPTDNLYSDMYFIDKLRGLISILENKE